MRLTTPIMINASVHDQSNMIVYFMSYVPDNYKYSFCLTIFNYDNHKLSIY